MIDYSRVTGKPIVVPAGVASGLLVGPSPNRVGLILTAALSGTITYSLSGVAVSGQGVVLSAGQTPCILTLYDHGQIVQMQWTLIHSVGGLSVEIVELMAGF